jgi:hypothetical protein
MSQTHTIVVAFPEGVVPRYSAATEFQGGRVVAVNFGGDQLSVVQELEEALEVMLGDGCWVGGDWVPSERAKHQAERALVKARAEL